MSGIVGQRVGFGIVFGFGLVDPGRLVADVQQAEKLGFDMVSFPDHLHGERPSVEPWTALTWAAAATERIAVMPNVLALPYRAPAVTAKMAETLDRLSSGRLVLGLGTGGYDPEFAAFGLAERTPSQKVSALGEALQIMRGLWSDPSVTFNGKHYHVREARIEPRPERPIPVWLGSYGPRGLRLTGALADGWIPSLGRVDLGQLRAMRTEVRAAAEAAGRDPDGITCAVNLVVAFGGPGDRDTPSAADSSAAWRPVSGGSEAIAEQLIGVVQAGFTFLNVVLDDPADRERFASEVIPAVRQRQPLPAQACATISRIVPATASGRFPGMSWPVPSTMTWRPRGGAAASSVCRRVQFARNRRGKPRAALMTTTGTSGKGLAAARSSRTAATVTGASSRSSSGKKARTIRHPHRTDRGNARSISSCPGSTRTRPAASSGRRKASSWTSTPPQLCPASTHGPAPSPVISDARSSI